MTPFSADGAVDETALRNLVAWQVESGIDFLVPCGTTGETPTLTHDEWLRVIDVTIEVAAGRVPIVAGATSNSTQEAVAKAKEVAARPGVDAILTASPYYNKPTQEGQYRHFRAIAEAVDKPLILYNVPGRTSANIEPATLARLSEVPNIAGVKEASGNITQIAEVLNVVPETFLVFSGDDAITLPVIALGGVGIVSVASNEIPREMAEMTRAALANDWQAARSDSPQISSADAGQLHRVESVAREGCPGHDGQDSGNLSPAAASDAPRHALEAPEDCHRCWAARPHSSARRSDRILRLRKLGGGTAQGDPAPRILWSMQFGQRAPVRPRSKSLALAWTVRQSRRSAGGNASVAGRADSQRMQVRGLKKQLRASSREH